jgi:hypothetical protein
VIDADRMLYIAGYNQPTYSGIRDWGQLRSTDGYEVTKRGDGKYLASLACCRPPTARRFPPSTLKRSTVPYQGTRP